MEGHQRSSSQPTTTRMGPRNSSSKTAAARAVRKGNATRKQANNVHQDTPPQPRPKPKKKERVPPPPPHMAWPAIEPTDRQEATTGIDAQGISKDYNGGDSGSYDGDHNDSNYGGDGEHGEGDYGDNTGGKVRDKRNQHPLHKPAPSIFPRPNPWSGRGTYGILAESERISSWCLTMYSLPMWHPTDRRMCNGCFTSSRCCSVKFDSGWGFRSKSQMRPRPVTSPSNRDL